MASNPVKMRTTPPPLQFKYGGCFTSSSYSLTSRGCALVTGWHSWPMLAVDWFEVCEPGQHVTRAARKTAETWQGVSHKPSGSQKLHFLSYILSPHPTPMLGLRKRDFRLLLELLYEVWGPRKLRWCYAYSTPRLNFTCPLSIRFCTHPSIWNFTHVSNCKCMLFPDIRQSYYLYKLASSFWRLNVWFGSGSKWLSMEILE
jgi:hypothetical protein